MLHTLHSLLAPAAMGRLTLVINHVLASEPVAVQRLRPHQGQRIELLAADWPRLLPPLPPLAFTITPAGLLEWDQQPTGAAADLRVRVDASNPARWLADALASQTPAVDIDGDAQLATDVNWLLQNLRWDVEADLERLMGPAAARQVHRMGSTLARGLRGALQAVPAWRTKP